MGAKFHFFTDPGPLLPQNAGHAFGPAPPANGQDRFRVTDTHSASAAAPAFAICDGLLCAQQDAQGTLTLILKPSEQPPFDFPAISYILYKGVDPGSLLAGDGRVDTLQTDNKLIVAIKAAWELPDNNNGATTPSRNCLGLHLNPTDYPTDDNPARFAGTEPLDRLFYDGDPSIQLPLVRGGWTLGQFAAGSACGIEIVVERIGRRPPIALARQTETVVAVPTLAGGANPAETFLHWDAKEAILDFVDPCAFWGAFFVAKLRVWNGSNSDFDKLSGHAIYETVLRGTAVSAANFANRNRAYLDIRNEHGNSLNYYQADGPNLQLTLDSGADIDGCEVNYYASGWPCFWADNLNLPSSATGDRIDVRFALPKTANTRPLIYVSTGYRDAFRGLKERQRFIDRSRRPSSPYLYEASITIPLADETGVKRIHSSYQRLHHFKRLVVLDGQPVPAANPDSLAPLRARVFDQLLPLLTPDDLPVADAPKILRTFDEPFYVESGVGGSGAYVARAAIAADDTNVALILVPIAHHTSAFSLRQNAVKIAWPSLTLPAEGASIFGYLSTLLPAPLQMVEVADPDALTDTVELLHTADNVGLYQSVAQNNPSAIVVSLSRTEIAELQAIAVAHAPAHGLAMLSLIPGDTYRDDVTSYVSYGVSLNLLTGSPTIATASQLSQIRIYCHG